MLSFQKLLKAEQISQGDLTTLFKQADSYKEKLEDSQPITDMQSKIMASLFFEPSTRTRFSFESAMNRLGGSVISLEGGGSSSVAKGETLEDTGQVMDQYADIIVMRHPQAHSVEEFATHVKSPVINAGDGDNEHPTQSLVDLYTIHSEKGTLKNLKICFIGDLKYGRTVHSLVKILAKYDCSFEFISSDYLRIPDTLRKFINDNGNSFEEHQKVESEVLDDLDVLYVTRVQKERFPSEQLYLENKDLCYLDKGHISATSDFIILHPLPRVDEMDKSIDDLDCAKYFDQVKLSVPIRMALLYCLSNS
ncbi:aspartate carbamoyltransferase [Francisella adeliensis]|uniref:Aspartate carbamoyltransferase n=1 Tax=Francisella adeliensis TaxID=2007306 RepID=A0A2Z4XXP2_9GAMM|nr:aspartate carbamoyltransferase [Francisella adeliensis]AXA33165.1 aspartate carbamoyltransferase [Francisella adeliensis]MBK2085943.1 aspartate carbamoyltransferase [Francisella adeliensis]MBK2096893.1 aspartate carbamoyltransferase [Francisella adeliensis]QIW11393.1 aspartate carbamoyltransferase [Francisella adeliensis]QIW13268.1 aspartate carbamoyltransferase [Francisella adeliensis]